MNIFGVFIYGINIPRCPHFTHDDIRGLLAPSVGFRLLGMTSRPDSLLIQSVADSSAQEAVVWVSKLVGRPAVARNLDELHSLLAYAVHYAMESLGESFQPQEYAASLQGRTWKLGAVFASHKAPGSVSLQDSSVVKVLARFQEDTVIVLKREQTDSGSRITWGERPNAVMRKPWSASLGHEVVCTSRAMSTVKKLVELLT